MTSFVLLAALLCVVALGWLSRPWWWPRRAAADAAAAVARPSAGLGVLLLGLVLAIVVGGYVGVGSPAHLDPAAAAAEASAGEGPASLEGAEQQIGAMVDRLAERLKTQPDDVEGWRMLGRSYTALGKPPEAAAAYRKASQLRPGDASLLAELAFAVAMANQRSFAGEPTALITRALTLAPDNPKALALAGSAAFDRKDYAAAVRHWEKLAAVEPPGGPFGQQLQASIAQARQLGGMAEAPPPAATAMSPAATPTAPVGQVSGSVSLAPQLKGRVGPDDTLFVFARAETGPRMPLAILRLKARDLPLGFKLDDSMAMSPAMKLSSVARVVVGARISKSGNATPQPGDLQGLSTPVAVGTSGLKLEINEAVGQP